MAKIKLRPWRFCYAVCNDCVYKQIQSNRSYCSVKRALCKAVIIRKILLGQMTCDMCERVRHKQRIDGWYVTPICEGEHRYKKLMGGNNGNKS